MNGISKCVCCVVVAGLLAGAPFAHADDVAWQSEFFKAMKTASEKQQPVIVFATMQGCGYCVRMQNEAYANQDVATELNQNFIPVLLDADHSSELLGRMGVSSYPTTIIYSPQGKLLSRLVGYESTHTLRQAMKVARQHRVATKSK